MKSVVVFAVLLTLAGCEQVSQSLPTGTLDQEISRVVPEQGSVLSSAAGASVVLPPGAVPAGTRVTMTPVALAARQPSGTLASAQGFELGPAGIALRQPAQVTLKLAPGADQWLASVVVRTPGGTLESGDALLDLTNGVIKGSVTATGTLMAVVPEAGAVVRATRIATASSSISVGSSTGSAGDGRTTALRGSCGAPGQRCDGLKIQVSDNLLAMSEQIAAVYPEVGGEIRIRDGKASGSLRLEAPLRFNPSRGSAISLVSEIVAEPTAASVVSEADGRITITDVRARGKVGSDQADETVTLTFSYAGDRAYVELDQTFRVKIGQEQETAKFVAYLPLSRLR